MWGVLSLWTIRNSLKEEENEGWSERQVIDVLRVPPALLNSSQPPLGAVNQK